MTWISSKKFRDFLVERETGFLDADDSMAALVDNRVVRVAGIPTTRNTGLQYDQLTGPYMLYDWRDWAGGSAKILNESIIALGSSYDLTVTGTTSAQGVQWQAASVTPGAPSLDWSAFGGAPDSAPFTFLCAFGSLEGQIDVAPNHEARFLIGGDVTFDCRVKAYSTSDNSAMIDWLVASDSSRLKVDNTGAPIYTRLARGVVVLTLDLPTGTDNGLWINRTAIPSTTTREVDYTSAPYPDFGTISEPTITSYSATLARGIPSVSSGRPNTGAYMMALYRGSPTQTDLDTLQVLYGLPV